MKTLTKQIIGAGNIKRVGRIKDAISNAFKTEKYSVFIDVTNGCNLRCAFCTHNNDKIVQMKTEEFDNILVKIHKYISGMQLSCAWEYSIAKNAPEIVRTIGKFRIPLTTQLLC